MKIVREKRIRSIYIQDKIGQVIGNIFKTVKGIAPTSSAPKKTPYNICLVTGKTKSVIKNYKLSRHVYRRRVDIGDIEGIRRGS